MTPDQLQNLLTAQPVGASPDIAKALAEVGQVVRAPAGATIFRPGDDAGAFLLLLSGSVRVETTAPGGRSAVLYRLAPGQSCVLTTSCLLSNRAYGAAAVAETDVEALAAPKTPFFSILMAQAEFRELVFGAYADRLADLTHVIEELLLKRVDSRLAHFLAERAPEIAITHEALAHELGAAREAVSRILKEFERRGWVTLGRGKVAVREPDALRRFADAIGAK